jgi:hypothetical protein
MEKAFFIFMQFTVLLGAKRKIMSFHTLITVEAWGFASHYSKNIAGVITAVASNS